MTRASSIVVCAYIVAALGCTTLVDVDDYTFDDAPCGPRPVACTGGREVAFVVRSLDVPRLDAAGHRDGFDLDGTDAPICGQTDFTAPDGRTGVDNAIAAPLEALESLTGMHIRMDSASAALMGDQLQLIVLTHVDDLANDDCIDVTRRPGVLRAGMTPADLDADHDGLLDADLALDYGPAPNHDPVACVIDHVVHVRFDDSSSILFPGFAAETPVERSRLRMEIAGDGTARGLAGASLPIAALEGGLPPAAIDFLRPRADLDPSSRTARDCSAISTALELDLVPCTLGTLRMP